MRRYFFNITFLIIITSSSFAQGNEVLYAPLSLEFKNIPVDSALSLIEKDIEYFFIYNTDLVGNKPHVSAQFINYPLSVILDSLFNNPILEYKILQKQIVIFKNRTKENIIANKPTPKKFKTINGIILDDNDNSTLPFSTVSILNKSVGTVSNLDGEFSFRIKEDYFNDTLAISHLGYEPLILNISDTDTNTRFKLLPKTISLQEIFIRWTDPKELLIKALKSVKENYADNPAQLRAFYRESLQRNNKYMIYTEGLLDIYKSAYRPTLFKDQAKLLQLRKFTNIETNDTILIKLQGGIEASLTLDLLRQPLNFISLSELNKYDYYYEGVESINDVSVHKIKFEPSLSNYSKDYTGSIYIDTESFAVTNIQFSLIKQSARKLDRNFVLKSKPGIKVLPKTISYNISYKKIGGKYYVNHIAGDMLLKVKRKRKLLSSKYKIHFEMITTDITTTDIQKFRRKERVRSRQILTDLRTSYLEDLNKYWGIDNFILPETDLLKALDKFNIEELTYLENEESPK